MLKEGQKVQQTVEDNGVWRTYTGYVVRYVEPTNKGVKVQWHKGCFSWEDENELIPVSNKPQA